MRNLPKDSLIVVAGGGGFIGGHLVADLLLNGYSRVRAVDIKAEDDWFQVHGNADNRRLDLREKPACTEALR